MSKTWLPERSATIRVFTLDVFIISGPPSEAFARKHKRLGRTIEIRSDQTLQDLHKAIFDAFGRYDEHMYEFQIGGKGPMDPKARRYVLPEAIGQPMSGPRPAGVVTLTTIGSLGLSKDDIWGYWFDFGDDWWHQITVVDICDPKPKTRYPRVTKRVGPNPPQYPDEDGEEE